MYELVTINENQKGYKISWEELEKILDKVVPDKELENGWYQKWHCNTWAKEINGVQYNRTYITQVFSKNYKRRNKDKPLGYYDNIENAYIVTSNKNNITDVIKLFKESEEIL